MYPSHRFRAFTILGFAVSLLTTVQALPAPAKNSDQHKQKTDQSSDQNADGLAKLIRFGLDHSLDQKSQELDLKAKEVSIDAARNGKYIPQIVGTAAYQKIYHDRDASDSSGNTISNNGNDTNFGVTATYDLQKLLGPELKVASKAADLAKLQIKITKRDLIRNIKKSYFQISEIQGELRESQKIVDLFERVKTVLHKQNKIGLYNDIELQQFQVQQSILKTDIEARKLDLDNSYNQLASLINSSVADAKSLAGEGIDLKKVSQPSRIDLSGLDTRSSNEIIQGLMQDYDLAKLQYESYRSSALPSVYMKAVRDVPTFVTSDGPQSTAEIGVSFPIDELFTRSKQKSQLSVAAEKAQVVALKAVQDYRLQVQLQTENLTRLKRQTALIDETFSSAQSLLNKSFLYYSQKRLDSLGTLDVFAKYLQASKNRLLNSQQIANTDADLEYLVGGSAQ